MDLGTGLQIGGLVIAAGALVWEIVASRAKALPELVDVRDLLDGGNPWADPDREHGGRPAMRPTIYHGFPIDGSPTAISGELERATKVIADQVEQDRERARRSWERQVTATVALHEANQAMLARMLDDVRSARVMMRVRVAIEMAGLCVAAIGTALG